MDTEFLHNVVFVGFYSTYAYEKSGSDFDVL